MTKITTRKTSTTTTTTTTTTTKTTTTTTSKHDWCYFRSNYAVTVQQRLNSSKDIIVVDEIVDSTYEKAKSVCENICGRLYFPSTLKEIDEIESVLNRCRVKGRCRDDIGDIWLRMTYNETVGTWYDPDNKEDLTFLNFNDNDNIRDFAGTKDRVSAKLC